MALARLFTAHRSVLYVDPASGELRHGNLADSPSNAQLVCQDRRAEILCTTAADQAIVCSANGCCASTRAAATTFELTQLGHRRLALRADDLFLSAIPDGRVALSAARCQAWETFLLATPDGDSLDSIGVKYGTDKSSLYHDYLDFYERFLAPLRLEPLSILEIGVWYGASLSMWAEYFPRSRIVGVDIAPQIHKHPNPRATIEIADQANVAHLARLGQTYGPFDLIIDDGSHMWDHQITSLRYLLPFVKPGGFYILEDLDTSYGSHIDQYRGKSSLSAADYLKSLCDYMVADLVVDVAGEPDALILVVCPAL